MTSGSRNLACASQSCRTSPTQTNSIMTDEKYSGAISDTSSASSIRASRSPRFAEATSVHSPVDKHSSPFDDPPVERIVRVHGQPGDIGFGYLGANMNRDIEAARTANIPLTPKAPLKSALKSPGMARTFDNPLSPTFREEDILEKKEIATTKQQKRDLVRT